MQASNDNLPTEGRQAQKLAAKGRQQGAGQCRVIVSMSNPLPVTDGEIVLIETYLSDVISAIIANDN